MVIAPELLAYWANIPISRLENEVAQMVAAMQSMTAREVLEHTRIVRPTYQAMMPQVLTDAQDVIAHQSTAGEAYGKLYYEDMPLAYRGRTIREAQEILPTLNGKSDHDACRL
jgi:hypothetical protein